MLAAEYRLTEGADFEKVKVQGKTYKSKNFTFGVLDREDASPSRFGFVIPTKVYSNATDRNRVKRVLSESTRHQLVFLKKGFDCVFIPNNGILRAYTHDVMKEVKEIFEEADMLV